MDHMMRRRREVYADKKGDYGSKEEYEEHWADKKVPMAAITGRFQTKSLIRLKINPSLDFSGNIARDREIVECPGSCQDVWPPVFYHRLKKSKDLYHKLHDF